MAIIAFDPAVPVFDRHAKSYPKYAEGEPATYGPFSEACATAFEWDAHFAAYSCPAMPRRLGTAGAHELKPKMVLLVLDVDGPDHKCTPEWWAAEKLKVAALFKKHGWGYCYTTRGGYRVILGLRDELVIDTPQAALRWRHSYLDWIAYIQREFQIACDDKCADWTRCFRLPRVARDNVPTTPGDELGEPDRMTAWREPYIAADDPRVLRTESNIEIPEPAPVSPEALEAAAEALVAAWPARSRHYAGMALSGALAKAGWSEGAIADFVCYVMWRTVGSTEEAKWTAQARDVLDKLHRGEQVTGWATLTELMLTAPNGQPDEARRGAVEAAILSARRGIGQPPAIELFDEVRKITKPAGAVGDSEGVKALLASARVAAPEDQGDVRFAPELIEMRAEVGAAPEFSVLLDDVATDLPPMIEQAESKSKAVDARPMFMTYREMRARNAPPPDFIVQNLIPKEGVGALSGEPKAAKSWDATYIAVCVAAGVPVLGQYAVQKPSRVAYFYAEDTESAVNNRVGAVAASLGLDPQGAWIDNLVMQPRGRPLDVLNTAQLCVLAASVRRYGDFGLMILDPLSNIHSGEEDKRDSMVKVMARLHALETFLKLAILFIHHSGKENADNKGRKRGGQKMRGSSAIHGAVDFGIYLSNLRGNGKTEFIARVESEMKAARGAGVFDRKLEIDDNEKGNALRAKFTATEAEIHDKGEGPKDLADERAQRIVKILWNQNGPMTFDDLKRKIGGKTDLLMRALEIAETEGWIKVKFTGARRAGYEITEKGRELIRDGGGETGGADGADAGGETPPAGAPDPALALAIGAVLNSPSN